MSFDEDACYDTCLDVPHVHGGKLIAIPGGNGPPGIQGPAGPPGVSDVPGPTGPAGPQGAPGPVGPTGPASTVPGPAGATGPAGPTGPEGPAGPAGAKGDTGATGADGVQGVQGEQGPAGLGIRYKGEVATVAELPTTGNVGGDLWVIGNREDDSKPADSYVWDEDQQDWVYAGAIQGVQGVQGVQGPVGPEGPAGADGATGPAGPKGDTGDQGPPGETSGVVGPEGPQGPPGADGATGPAGPQGDVGPAGAKGDPGEQGPIGLTGPAGADGAPGPAGPSQVSADAGNASILGTDGLIFTPAGGGGGLVTAPDATAFPATGESGKVYLAEDTGDTFRFDATAKGTDSYVRISESTLSTKIEDSTEVGRDLVTAATPKDGRDTINAIGKVAPATGAVADDVASITDTLAVESFARVEDGTYLLGAAGVVVPASKRLAVSEGSKLCLDAGLDTSAAIRAVTLNDCGSFVGAVDGNRANLDKAGFNATAGVNNFALAAFGVEGTPLTNLHVDAVVTGAADYIGNFYYVNDSYVRIRASDCGGPVTFNNCHDVRVDIEIDGHDNEGWKNMPHAVDFINCTGISGRVVIRGQKGTGTPAAGTSLSNWFSGLTLVNCSDLHFDEIDVEAADVAGQSKGLGVSMLGVRNLHCSKTRIVGYSDLLLELGGVVDSTFAGLNLDGRYAVSAAGDSGGGGISLYNNANNAAITGRTKEHTRNVKFIGGSITRCLDNAIKLQAATDTSWYGISVTGSLTGVSFQFANAQATDGAAPSPGSLRGHRFFGCDFSFNERNGVRILDGIDIGFHACHGDNNGQAMTFGTTRRGATKTADSSGFGTQTSTTKTGLMFNDCRADDTQGFTAPGFPDPSRPLVIAVDKPEQYGVGQTVTIVGGGAAGADLLTRVNDIIHDELTLQHPIGTFPAATLTGTIAVAGTAVTGTGTVFNTELVGRGFVKVGADYRRILKVTSDTAATLESAFPANVPAGTALTVVRASITAGRSQQYGFVISPDAPNVVMFKGRNPVGNVAGQIVSQAPAATPTRYVAGTTSTNPELLELGVGAGGRGKVQVSGPDVNHPISLNSKGVGSISLRDGNDTSVFDAIPVASAVNRLTVSNATAGGSPSITIAGSDANAGLTFLPKGTGRFTIYSPTGQTPTIQASGADATHGLNLNTKNSGLVQVNGLPVGVKTTKPVGEGAAGLPGQFAADASGTYMYIGDGTTHKWSGVVTGALTGGGEIKPLSLWTGTKAAYDAIATKSATTIYVVTAVTAVTGDITVDEGAETGDIAVEPPAPEVVADETAAEPKAAPATKSTRKK
jgi:hypothetical protein